jgi:hypothetical protein
VLIAFGELVGDSRVAGYFSKEPDHLFSVVNFSVIPRCGYLRGNDEPSSYVHRKCGSPVSWIS